ncbi:hypothetical protein [Pseudovibrio brasiliensis]|uniref:Uncharacterized protein n=1 Tax=Pseudovibrio brasiliensis TaxID=1898042 RepID=A0ABX8ARI9_9HYPH|nr:hypothetical protein [Pseudovibrio brasiliensis]QUS57330.1 hypothetical protein KGB56_08055 [Pseudovibrio brasiliensis]
MTLLSDLARKTPSEPAGGEGTLHLSPAFMVLPFSIALQFFQIPFLCLHQLGSAALDGQSARLTGRCQRNTEG